MKLSLSRISKSGLAAACLLVWSVQFCRSQELAVQVNPNQSFDTDDIKLSRQPHSFNRFLGWKYAALAKQDTSKWTRPDKSTALNQVSSVNSFETKASSNSASSANPFVEAGFASPTKLPTGFLPTAVVQGDFNGDGTMDLAVSNGGDNTIYVYPGNGDGTFAIPEVLYTAGQSPVWLAAAQLRASGHVDLIAVDGDSNQVEVFFGNGDGTFQPPAVVATLSQTPTFVLAGDFNNDGNVDLAVGLAVAANAMQPQFEVLLSDGTGAFPSAITPPLIDNESDSPLPTNWLASGDVNNDHLLDLVATVAFEGAITYLNQGGTRFQEGPIFNPGDGAVAVGLGDMNGDGCLDAIETGGYGWLTIAKGNCNGTFTQNGFTAELGDIDYAVTVADINGDGKLDVVASSAFSEDEVVGGIGAVGGYLVSVLDGDGAGNVSPPSIYRVGADAFSFAVSDLTGDGFPDIITISQHESSSDLLVNDGKGGFGTPSGEAVGYIGGVSNAPNSLATPQTVDVNGDGKPDVVLMEYGQNSSLPNQVAVLLNDGTGKLKPPIRSPITVGPSVPDPVFVVANFRSATAPDLIYVSTYDSPYVIAFMPGNGDGTFGAATTLATLPNPYQVVAGDFNGDGKLDFAVLGYASVGTLGTYSTWQLDVFLGNGDGTFKHLQPQEFPALTSAYPYQLLTGDFNHDGKVDLLIGSNTNGGWVASGDDLDLALGNGDGTFQTPTTLFAHFGPVAVADLNNDGYLDLVQARDPNADITQDALNIAGGNYFTPAITLYLGGPGGVFTQQATYFAPGLQFASTFPALVGRFEGSGNLDIALPIVQSTLTGPGNEFLQIFQGDGTGAFIRNGIAYQLPLYDSPVVGADYRGVGLTDLLDLLPSTSSINTISASPAPALAITADSSPLSGNQGSATVTLALPPTTNETVELSSSDPTVTLPSDLTFNPAQSQQSFSFSVGPGFSSSHLLAITGSLAGQTATAYFARANPNLNPGVSAFIGGTVFPTTSVLAFPNGSIPLFLTLQSLEGYSGTFGQFTCSGLPAGANCDFSQSNVVLLPGGYAQVTFNLTTSWNSPVGSYALSILASNGEISASAPLTLDVGGFTLSATPSIVQTNGPNAPNMTVTGTFSSFFNQTILITCDGLPTGATCTGPGLLSPSMPTGTAMLSALPGVSAQDYPFQVVATYDNASASVKATLRVSSFSAALQTNSATISNGQSATFNVEFTSLNHFTNSQISLSCQSTSNVTCSTASQVASLSDGGTATLALKVTPPASTTAMAAHAGRSWTVAIACFVLSLFSPKRSPSWRLGFLNAFVLLVLVSAISACSGGGSGTGGGGGGGGGTSQTYTINVTALATTGSGTLQVPVGAINLSVIQ